MADIITISHEVRGPFGHDDEILNIGANERIVHLAILAPMDHQVQINGADKGVTVRLSQFDRLNYEFNLDKIITSEEGMDEAITSLYFLQDEDARAKVNYTIEKKALESSTTGIPVPDEGTEEES